MSLARRTGTANLPIREGPETSPDDRRLSLLLDANEEGYEASDGGDKNVGLDKSVCVTH